MFLFNFCSKSSKSDDLELYFKQKKQSPKQRAKDHRRLPSRLHLSLITDSGESLREVIPEGDLHLIGNHSPLFVKKRTVKSSPFLRAKTRSVIRNRFYSEDEETLGVPNELTTFANKIFFEASVLVVGEDNPMVLSKICRTGARVVWFPNDFSAVNLNYPNLVIKESFNKSQSYHLRSLFARNGSVPNKIDFIHVNLNCQKQHSRKMLQSTMKKLSGLVRNLMVTVPCTDLCEDPEFLEDLFSNVDFKESNSLEVLNSTQETHLYFGNLLPNISEKEIEEYTQNHFFAEKMNFENEASLGLLKSQIGKGKLISELKNYEEAISNDNFNTFFEYISNKHSNPSFVFNQDSTFPSSNECNYTEDDFFKQKIKSIRNECSVKFDQVSQSTKSAVSFSQ